MNLSETDDSALSTINTSLPDLESVFSSHVPDSNSNVTDDSAPLNNNVSVSGTEGVFGGNVLESNFNATDGSIPVNDNVSLSSIDYLSEIDDVESSNITDENSTGISDSSVPPTLNQSETDDMENSSSTTDHTPYIIVDYASDYSDTSENTTNDNTENPHGHYDNSTSCQSKSMNQGKQQIEEVVSFSYAIETSSILQNTPNNQFLVDDETLIEDIEKLIHESQVLMWLKCLHDGSQTRNLIRGLQSDTEITPYAIISSPSDTRSTNLICQADQIENDQNDCFIVEGEFSLKFSVDDIDDHVQTQVNQTVSDSLSIIEKSMTDGSYADTINTNLASKDIHIVKLTYLSDAKALKPVFPIRGENSDLKSKTRWKTVLGFPFALVVLLMLVLFFGCKRRRRNIEKKRDLTFPDLPHEGSNGTDELEDDDSSGEFVNDLESGYPMKSTPSISSYNGSNRHDLDVHKCMSASCQICRSKRTTAFLPVNDDTESIPLPKVVEDKWWLA